MGYIFATLSLIAVIISFTTTAKALASFFLEDTRYVNVEFFPYIYSFKNFHNYGIRTSSIDIETMIYVLSKRFSKITVEEMILPDAKDPTSTQLMISKLVAYHNNASSTQKLELTLKVSFEFHKLDDILDKIAKTNEIYPKTVQAVIVDPEEPSSELPTNLTGYLKELHDNLKPFDIKLGVSLQFSQCDSEFETEKQIIRTAKIPEGTKRLLNVVDFVTFGSESAEDVFNLTERIRNCEKSVRKLSKHVSVHLGPVWTATDEKNGNSTFEFVKFWDDLAHWANMRQTNVYMQSAFDNPPLELFSKHDGKGFTGWFRLKDEESLDIGKDSFTEKADDLSSIELNKLKYRTRSTVLWDSLTDGDDEDENRINNQNNRSGKEISERKEKRKKSSGFRSTPFLSGIASLILIVLY